MATNLKDLIDKLNAEDIPTNIFTIEDEDPYVILGKLNEVIAYLEQLRDTISSSDNKANQALENALQALQTATRAIEGSNQALDSSNTALNTANTAIATANSSLEQALEALQKANNADSKADNAVNTANEALEQVTLAQGSKVYDNNGNLMASVNFNGENGINIDVNETDPSTIDIRLDNTITEAIEDTHNTAEANKEAITATNTALSNTNSRVSSLENDNTTNKSKIATLETESSSIDMRVDSLEGDVSSLNSQMAKTLKTPMSSPASQKLVSIDTSNSQNNIDVGEGLIIENDTIKNTRHLYSHTIKFGTNVSGYVTTTILTDNNTPFTFKKLAEWLYQNGNGFTDSGTSIENNNKRYWCTGAGSSAYHTMMSSPDGNTIRLYYGAFAQGAYALTSATWFVDTIVQIF